MAVGDSIYLPPEADPDLLCIAFPANVFVKADLNYPIMLYAFYPSAVLFYFLYSFKCSILKFLVFSSKRFFIYFVVIITPPYL